MMEMVVESMEMAPRSIPRPGKVPEQRLLSPESRLRWRRRSGTRGGKRLLILGFASRGPYMGERVKAVEGRGHVTTCSRGPEGSRATGW